MHWRWRKRVSTLVVSAALLSVLPIGGVVASPLPQLSDSPIYHSVASNDYQISNDSTNPSEALLSSKSSNKTETLAFAGGLKQSDFFEQKTISTSTYNDTKSRIFNPVHVSKELVDKRSRNSKTFLNSDGTTSVETAVYSLNYFNGQVWQDIDTTIREDHSDPNYTHSMLANNFKVRLHDKGNKQSVTFSVYDQAVTYKAEGMSNVTGVFYRNTITYPNAWQSTDLQYQVQNDKLKMQMVLQDNKAPKTFSFEMKTKSVKHRVNVDGSIDFVDKDGKVNFKIPQMWVQDASSEMNRYDRLKVHVKQKGNKSVIEMTLDDKGLQYPIVIDPTTTMNFSSSIGFISTVNGGNFADTTPTIGAMGSWGVTYGAAIDYANYSVGVDLGGVRSVGKLELWNVNSSSRLSVSDYTLYSSNDNVNFTAFNNWIFSSSVMNGHQVHTFTFMNLNTRYIKVHTRYTDTNYTFAVGNLQTDIRVYDQSVNLPMIPDTVGYNLSDSNPTSGSIAGWGYASSIAADAVGTSLGFDLGNIRGIGKIELWDNDGSSRTNNQGSYTLYSSNDNVTYSPVNNWSFSYNVVNSRLVHTFTFTNLSARYIKIHTTVTDGNYTFVLSSMQTDAKVYDQSVNLPMIPDTVGYNLSDSNPTSGSIAGWGYASSIAADAVGTSLGFDLGNIRGIGKIELWDNDGSSRTNNQGSYTSYSSNDNVTYSPVNNWSFSYNVVNSRLVHTFTFINLSARYIKIHTTVTDGNYTFVLSSMQTDAKVYNPLMSYIYDIQNRLTAIYYYKGNFFYRVDFSYDSNGNLLKKVINQLN